MARGFDTNNDCSDRADRIKAQGYDFVARYYKFVGSSVPLTRDEALSLSAAGLFIVVVMENGFPDHIGYFSYSKGVHDGTLAYHYAVQEIGQPAGTPIYFAADFDPGLSEIVGSLNDYFRGIRDGFNTISGGSPAYRIGVYGSGCTCAWLRSHTNYVTHTWLAQSTGFCGSRTFSNWNIKQGPGTTILGLSADTDTTQGDYGGFQVSDLPGGGAEPVSVFLNGVQTSIPALLISDSTQVGVRAFVETLGGTLDVQDTNPLQVTVSADRTGPLGGQILGDVGFVLFRDVVALYDNITFDFNGEQNRLDITRTN